jgi:hypothetical protein
MNLKSKLKGIFYELHLRSNVIKFQCEPSEETDEKYYELKSLLNNIGIDVVNYYNDSCILSVVTTEDKEEDVLSLANNFGFKLIDNGFELSRSEKNL